MVSSSIPVYLDPPSWQQEEQNIQLLGGGDGQRTILQLPPLPSSLPVQQSAGGQSQPGSMAERARMAKFPYPEAALKCPRCESTNTKFCYYNNYSLLQPRHFCKACRRYWTRGGTIRNVPVGGGCRRNRRSKGRGGSKSQAIRAVIGSCSSNATPGKALPPPPPPPAQLPFLPPLQSLSDYGNLEFQVGTSNSSGGSGQTLVPNGLLLGEQWRVQQFPFSANMGTTQASGLLQFEQNDQGTSSNQGLDLMSRNLLGLSGTYNHQPSWNESNGNAWTDGSIQATSSITYHHQ